MMARVLITGAAGFLGRSLIESLAGSHEIIGIDIAERPAGIDVDWRRVGDRHGPLAEAIRSNDYGILVHAAFVNKKPSTWTDEEYLARQLESDRRLFRRCAEVGLRVVLISSSAVYGAGGGAEELDEETPRRPVSLYGVSKALQEMLAQETEAAAGLELVIVRLFNLVGPGQALGMIVPDWVRQVSAIVDGAEPLLEVQTLETSRDFVDVRDAARAVALLVGSFDPGGVFNVASGQAVRLRELAAFLATLSPVAYETVERLAAPGAANALSQRGDATRIRQFCGWRTEVDWRQSVSDFWEGYRLDHRLE